MFGWLVDNGFFMVIEDIGRRGSCRGKVVRLVLNLLSWSCMEDVWVEMLGGVLEVFFF